LYPLAALRFGFLYPLAAVRWPAVDLRWPLATVAAAAGAAEEEEEDLRWPGAVPEERLNFALPPMAVANGRVALDLRLTLRLNPAAVAGAAGAAEEGERALSKTIGCISYQLAPT
jgi:hypothetical protein